jgi:serine/threonine protein kinase
MSTEYKILRHLGPSGKGQLFLAITSENFLVALKIILDKKYVETEVEQLKSLKKKNIECCLPFIDYFIIEQEDKRDQYYIIVMKYFEGYVLLSDFLNKSPFQLTNLKDQIKRFIEVMHKNHIVHSDIHLGNILIHSKSGQIKIIDLGFCISKFGNQLFGDTEPLGISDEQFKLLVQRELQLIDNLIN